MPQSDGSIVHFQALGPGLVTRGDGGSTPLLTQPRRLAVLAYLVLARPRGLHSRDTVVAMLWPEADQASGRHALRNILHGIRRALGDVIVSAGDEQVGINRQLVSCDAITVEAYLASGRMTDALDLYHGELLQGFHVGGAPDFDQWLDGERRRLHESVFRAAAAVAEQHRTNADPRTGLSAARRARSLAPDDELSLRRLMEALDHAGDRAGALREYDRFAARAREAYGFRPAAATLELLRSLRSRSVATPAEVEVVAREPETRTGATLPGERAPTLTAHSTASTLVIAPPDRRARVAVRRLAIAAMLTLLVLATTIPGLRSQLRATGADGFASAARNDGLAQLTPLLPERYRADTALVRRYLAAEADLEGLRLGAARKSFLQLVDEHPLYAPAWAGLSFALFQSSFNEIPPSVALPRAVAAANRALALDSTLVEAERSLIANAMFGQWDLVEAKRRLDAALSRSPDDPELKNLLATWHRWRGEHDAAIQLKREAVAIDPLSPRYANQVGSSLYFAHRCAEAVDIFTRIPEEQRRQVNRSLTLYRSLKCLGKRDEAAGALRESLLAAGDTGLAKLLDPPLSAAKRDAATRGVFRDRLQRRLQSHQRWSSSAEVMTLYAELGDRDSTLVWLDSMYVERAMMLHVVPFDPLMDFVRDDPRFAAFLRRLPWVRQSGNGN